MRQITTLCNKTNSQNDRNEVFNWILELIFDSNCNSNDIKDIDSLNPEESLDLDWMVDHE